ncbi:MAG: aldolase/citrate lyase family protein [Desulfobacterales bacterium]|nr:aldolase/citrate lyase family protein [Desulfobacterales bacterium]
MDLKQKLAANIPTLGSWLTFGNTAIAEIMARSGFDWLVVDLEHSVISIEMAGEMIRVIDLCGVPALVRLTSNDPCQIKRVMDAGAHGIVVPMVNSVDDARQAVAAVQYAPIGSRGVGLARAQGYGTEFKEYMAWNASSSVVIVQIEHESALTCLEEILTVPGVDGFIVGPYDLSCSMGIPGEFSNPRFVDTLEHIKDVGKKLGVTSGLHVVEPDTKQMKTCFEDGYGFVAYSVDMRLLETGARFGVETYKEKQK